MARIRLLRMAVLVFAGLLPTLLGAGGTRQAAGAPALVFPPTVTGNLKIVRTREFGDESLTFRWSGVLQADKSLNEVAGPFVATYGLGNGSFSVSGGGVHTSTLGDGTPVARDTWTFAGHVKPKFDTEHVSIYVGISQGILSARVGAETGYALKTLAEDLFGSNPPVRETTEDIFHLLGLADTATLDVALKPKGAFSTKWDEVVVTSPPYTYTISGSFKGSGTWGLAADRNPIAFESGKPNEVTVRVLGLPDSARLTWSGVPRTATYEDKRRTVKIRYAKPGRYTLHATSGRRTEKLDVYVVQAKFAGELERIDRTGQQELPKSVAPSDAGTDTVRITPNLTGSPYSVELDVSNGDDGDAGSAHAVPDRVKKTGEISVVGDAQTSPGHSGQLRLRAMVNGQKCGEAKPGDGFSVCAHPTSIGFHHLFALAGTATDFGTSWGQEFTCRNVLGADPGVGSDSGSWQDLDQVQLERGFKLGTATGVFALRATTDLPSDFRAATTGDFDVHALTGTALSLQDLFASVVDDAQDAEAGAITVQEVFRFSCDRCGIPAQAGGSPLVHRSGFGIDYRAFKRTGGFFLSVRKYGSANRGAKAGASDVDVAQEVEIK